MCLGLPFKDKAVETSVNSLQSGDPEAALNYTGEISGEMVSYS